MGIFGDSLSYTFREVPLGVYAVAVIHDSNMNGQLDRGLFGIPREEYAFSNNVFGVLGPPKFENASFVLDANREALIEVRYWSPGFG